MVIFDQLRISSSGKEMYLDFHINTASYFDNVYLRDITIMAADQVSETAPEGIITDGDDKPVEDTYVYHQTFEDNLKTASLMLTPNTEGMIYQGSSFSGPLFFVYIRVNGCPDECTPCALDKETTLGVTFDENLLYQKVMDYTKELAESCGVHQDFTDFILQWNAFKASVETEHYIPAKNFYNMMFTDAPTGKTSWHTNKCRCHG